MERFENLLDFINELNENGRIPYDDYSRLFDLVQEFAGAEEAINAAATDIAALLWLNGNCEYCEHGEKEEFSGANRWHCRLGNGIDCRPVWRGAATKASLPEIHKAEPTSLRAKPSRAETMFGPKETWAIPDRAEAEETTPKTYKGFLLIRCAQCGELRGFCAKQPISSYRCATCNGETPLHDLTSAHIRCKCGSTSNTGRISRRTSSPTAAFPAARRSIWPITRKLAPIRRCDDAHYHRSRQCSGRTGHWHKGADCSGFGAIRRYPCGVGRGSAANIPANADWRDCQPAGRQEEVRTDWGELLRRFRN